MIPLNMDGVDDIFKSFVSTKLKQLGINGVKIAEEKLEESLKKSLTDANKTNKSQGDVNEDKTKKDKKHKHKKKKKKHKEEKKKSKKEKENKECIAKVAVNGKRKSDNEKLDQPLKKMLIVEEEENVIKDKTLNCYHDTVIKIKEIENLSATLQVEPEETPQVIVTDTEKEEIRVSREAIQSEANSSSTEPSDKVLPTNQTDIVKHQEVPQTLTQTSQAPKKDLSPNLTQTENNTENTLTATLKEIKSMADMAAEVLPKNDPSTAEKTTEAKHTTSHKHSHDSSRHSKKHSSRRHSRSSRSRSRSHSKKRSHRSKRSRSRSRSRSRHRHHRRHHSRSRDHKRKHRRHHRRSRSLSPVITKEDKVKLLAIAKANVLAQHKADITINNLSLESKALLRSGGFTVQQLTGVCKDIAEGKREVQAGPSVVQPTPPAPVHHPFQVKPTPAISFNIKSTPIVRSTKPINELTKEFPVSSGSQHQKEEVYGKWEPVKKEKEKEEKQSTVCPEPPVEEESNAVLIQNVIAERVHAARQLQSNPSDVSAKKKIEDSQQKLNSWTNSLKMPGRFTGSSSLQPLSRSELERGQSAWANTQTFNSTKQVEGIGKSLLQKMGWRDGESLGKTNVGLLEPLRVSVKTDRKGLSSFMEAPAPPSMPTSKIVVKDLSGKHPVSALMEICTKRRWPAPDFRLVLDSGPDHSRQFLFKVTVNNTAYQPSQAAMNKKIAKAQAAEAVLQAMGLLQS